MRLVVFCRCNDENRDLINKFIIRVRCETKGTSVTQSDINGWGISAIENKKANHANRANLTFRRGLWLLWAGGVFGSFGAQVKYIRVAKVCNTRNKIRPRDNFLPRAIITNYLQWRWIFPLAKVFLQRYSTQTLLSDLIRM